MPDLELDDPHFSRYPLAQRTAALWRHFAGQDTDELDDPAMVDDG